MVAPRDSNGRWPYQRGGLGALHKKDDITAIQGIDLGDRTLVGDLIKRLRALTTNKIEEAAYFEMNGKKYRVQSKTEEK